jgi:hypothetical protein
MEWIVLLIIIVVIVLIVSGSSNNSLSYNMRGPLFTAAERSFLGVLDLATPDEYRVFGKVRIADILTPKKGMNRKNWQIAFNKISAKHFDYVLCNKETLEVVLVIELDDKSHNKKSVKVRDAFVNSACKTAELKLLRIPAKSKYSVNEVSDAIKVSLQTSK